MMSIGEAAAYQAHAAYQANMSSILIDDDGDLHTDGAAAGTPTGQVQPASPLQPVQPVQNPPQPQVAQVLQVQSGQGQQGTNGAQGMQAMQIPVGTQG